MKGGISQLKAGLGGSSIAGVIVFKTLCRAASLASSCLCSVSWWCWLILFPFASEVLFFLPVIAPISPAASRPQVLGVGVQQEAREGQSSVLPTGGHCHHSISGQLLLRPSRNHRDTLQLSCSVSFSPPLKIIALLFVRCGALEGVRWHS